MPIIAAYLYRHGRRVREIAIDKRVDCPADRSEFVWIELTDPCADELDTLRQLYSLHPLAVEDALKDGQLPRVDIYGDQLFVIDRTAHLVEGCIVYVLLEAALKLASEDAARIAAAKNADRASRPAEMLVRWQPAATRVDWVEEFKGVAVLVAVARHRHLIPWPRRPLPRPGPA